MKKLDNNIAVILGGSGDIGQAIARAYLKEGAIVILSSRNKEKLQKVAKKLDPSEKKVIPISADLRSKEQVDFLVSQIIDRFNKIDILVVSSGVQVRKPIQELTLKDWELVISVNLTGAFLICQAATKHMIKKNYGKIIFISSLTSEFGLPNMSPYVASKGGCKQFSKALSVELAPYNITVNCIGPGRLHTQMTHDIFSDKDKKESFIQCIPLKRAGTPEDLTGTAILLASKESNYITGQDFYIDGGWLASGGSPQA